LSTDIRLVVALAFGVSLAGCGSGSRSGSDGVASLPDGAASLPDAAASLSDGAAAGTEAAATAPPDVAKASEAGASADRPSGAVEARPEAAVLQVDASVDLVAVASDGPSVPDSPQVTPDVAAPEVFVRTDVAEALSRPDTDGLDAAKPGDATVVDTATPTTDLAPATLAEMSPQQLHTALTSKDFLLIDVHYPNAGSIPGTDARIAYDNIPALLNFIGPNLDTKVVLTCLSGGMSKSAGNALVARGYRNISELQGGMSAWTAAGYTLVRLDGGL